MGHPTGGVLALLRAEGAAVAIGTGLLAWHLGPPWWLTVAALAAPDLSLAGYALGSRPGAILYDAVHTYLGPALLGGAALLWASPAAGAVAALWALHIGVDRALGFGLKYPSARGDTHLGRAGRRI